MNVLKYTFSVLFFLIFANAWSQDIPSKLQSAFTTFEKDEQLKYALASLCVYDATTSKPIFEKNSAIGLAPASTQKIFTAIAAFDILGKNFSYKTDWLVDESNGLYINASGDPTMGSTRFTSTNADSLLSKIFTALRKQNIKKISSFKLLNNSMPFTVPDGWIWEDIGNYYGAGHGQLNWRENQYDIYLESGSHVGDTCKIIKIEPMHSAPELACRLKAAAKGTGDNAFIYAAPGSYKGYISGTIPMGEKNFKISGAMPSPANSFLQEFLRKGLFDKLPAVATMPVGTSIEPKHILSTYSPRLDSIVYWFLQKSINLYGEALLKKIAEQKTGNPITDSGVVVLKKFYKNIGIDERELNITDGSGLSPLNRVTTHAQVLALLQAGKANWFKNFYTALPLYNGMKMKSGTINNVKGYCGYHTSSTGKQYVFSFLVNNYNGSGGALVQKMYEVLNVLK